MAVNPRSLSFYGADEDLSGSLSAPVPKTTAEIVAALTIAQGLLPLAAERLKMSPDEIIMALASDPQSPELLSSYFKTSLMVSTYMNLNIFAESVMKCIAHGDYPNDIKAMSAFASLFADLTKSSPSGPLMNVNVFERTMSMLPKPVRDQVFSLVEAEKAPSEESPYSLPISLPKLGRARPSSTEDED